jgi:hypothetical protein
MVGFEGDVQLEFLAGPHGLQLRANCGIRALQIRQRNRLVELTHEPHDFRFIRGRLAGQMKHRHAGLDFYRFLDRPGKFQDQSGLVRIIALDGGFLGDFAGESRRVQLERDHAGLAGFDFAIPISSGGATASGKDTGDFQQRRSGIREDKIMAYQLAHADLPESEGSRGKLNARDRGFRGGDDCGLRTSQNDPE